MTSQPLRTSRTSQNTTLKANSIRPYPALPRHLASESVTRTDVPRHATSAALSERKLEAIRRGASTRGGRFSTVTGLGSTRRRVGGRVVRGVVAMLGRASLGPGGSHLVRPVDTPSGRPPVPGGGGPRRPTTLPPPGVPDERARWGRRRAIRRGRRHRGAGR